MKRHEQIAAAKKAYEVAKKSFNSEKTTQALADEAGISRTILTYARTVIQYGTEEENKIAAKGELSMQVLGTQIRKRLTPEQVIAQRDRSNAAREEVTIERDQFYRIIWSQLKPAIDNLSKMPDADSVVSVVKANNVRENTVNQHIQAARAWLEEFAYAWEQYQQSKGGNANA